MKLAAITVEKARTGDTDRIHQLISYFSDRGEMLPRPLSRIQEGIRDYFIVKDGEQVVGCAALEINWSYSAEIRSVAVAEDSQKQGIGRRLVKACLEDARALGVPAVFCLTSKTGFFKKFGFSPVDKTELPSKILDECSRCPRFPDCDEVTLICHLETPPHK
ncbi:MAG: N-acetyltransferase [Dehalococcoidales bacterium]|nr:N-acetyltransferase [Dehalococcoidales bacterium]MDP6633143.1 N-acetyltransferase [Dehalococcoidales bacterium]